MKIMISRFAGICRDCGEKVAKGETIAYHGPGAGISHAECVDLEDQVEGDEQECRFPPSASQLRCDRDLSQKGVSVVRTSSGWVGTRNSLGRCEDAPCCGCCTF